MTVFLVLFLILSLSVNGLLGWYIVRLLRMYLPMSADFENLFDKLDEYHFHIDRVSEMESFYGDEIILNLLRHSRSITDEVDIFKRAYSLFDSEPLELEEGEELDGEQEEDNVNTKEQEVLGVVHNVHNRR